MLGTTAIPAYSAYMTPSPKTSPRLSLQKAPRMSTPSPMARPCTHLPTSLHGGIGQFHQNDAKLFVPSTYFTAMSSQETRVCAGQHSNKSLSSHRSLTQGTIGPTTTSAPTNGGAPQPPHVVHPPVMVQHDNGGTGAPVFNMDAAALCKFFNMLVTAVRMRGYQEMKMELEGVTGSKFPLWKRGGCTLCVGCARHGG